MLPIPIMSTETLESCAEIGHTKAARTCAEHKTRFIMRQTGRVESLKVRFLVSPVIALLQRHFEMGLIEVQDNIPQVTDDGHRALDWS